MAAKLSPPRLLPSGDSAITVEFSRHIDDAANQRVLALDRELKIAPIDGVTETVPTYRSLLVHYDTVRIDFETLGAKLVALAQLPLPAQTSLTARRWRIPVAYGGENGAVHGELDHRLRLADGVGLRHRVAGLRSASPNRH